MHRKREREAVDLAGELGVATGNPLGPRPAGGHAPLGGGPCVRDRSGRVAMTVQQQRLEIARAGLVLSRLAGPCLTNRYEGHLVARTEVAGGGTRDDEAPERDRRRARRRDDALRPLTGALHDPTTLQNERLDRRGRVAGV